LKPQLESAMHPRPLYSYPSTLRMSTADLSNDSKRSRHARGSVEYICWRVSE